MSGFGAADLLGWTPETLKVVERLRGWTEAAIGRLELAYARHLLRDGDTAGALRVIRAAPGGRSR
jgi:hypothetical protein